MISHYTKVDGILAITIYVFSMIIFCFTGVLFIRNKIYLGTPISLLLIVVCMILVLVRKQKLASIGFTLKYIGKALVTGTVLGILFSFFMHILPNILEGSKIIPLNKAIYNIFYYFIIISLSEEVIFRGYIQTRLYGFIKNDNLAVLVAGIMFYAMHLPFQMPVNGMQINLFNMAFMVFLHFVMNSLYRKYNNLTGAIVFHGLLNWCSNLFR